MLENEYLFNRKKLFGHVKYLVMVKDDTEKTEQDKWNKFLADLKEEEKMRFEIIEDKISKQNVRMLDLKQDSQRRFAEAQKLI